VFSFQLALDYRWGIKWDNLRGFRVEQVEVKLEHDIGKALCPGPLVVFQHHPGGSGDVKSTLPKTFAGLFPCKSRAMNSMPPGEFPDTRRQVLVHYARHVIQGGGGCGEYT